MFQKKSGGQGEFGGGAFVAPDGSQQQAQYSNSTQPQQQQQTQHSAMVRYHQPSMSLQMQPTISPQLDQLRTELYSMSNAEVVVGIVLIVTSIAANTWFFGICLLLTCWMCRAHFISPLALMTNSCLFRPVTFPGAALLMHALLAVGGLFALIMNSLYLSNHTGNKDWRFYLALAGAVVNLAGVVLVIWMAIKLNQFKPLFQQEYIAYMQQSSQQALGNQLQMPLMQGQGGMQPASPTYAGGMQPAPYAQQPGAGGAYNQPPAATQGPVMGTLAGGGHDGVMWGGQQQPPAGRSEGPAGAYVAGGVAPAGVYGGSDPWGGGAPPPVQAKKSAPVPQY